MARGFGATAGGGTTDRIVSALTTLPAVLSLSIWARIDGGGGDSFGAFCEATSERCIFRNAHGTTQFQFYRAWDTAPFGATYSASRAGTNGVWAHYGVTYDGTNAANDPILYLNGTTPSVSKASSNAGTVVTTASAWWIGNRVSDQSKCFDGLLGEWAAWNRILTGTEMARLAAGWSPMAMPVSLMDYVPLLDANLSRVLAAPTITGTAVVLPHPVVGTGRLLHAVRNQRAA